MQRRQLKSDQYAVKLHTLYAGGLIPVSLVVLPSFLSIGTLETAALISVIYSAVGLPLLSGTLVLNIVESKYQYSSSPAVSLSVHVAFLLGVLSDVVGIGAAFWHVT